ncbi:MAG: CoA transferase [Ilumatobacteraceae bacterium]
MDTVVDTGGNSSRHAGALRHIRICDLSGQLAGAGATRVLAAFGAQVIRIEDPVTKGLWDIVRQLGPSIHGDTSHEGGSGFNNHNVEKLGVTIDLRTERGKELLRDLVRSSDAVTENFSSGVMERLGFGYESLQELKPDIVYVSNSGFGHAGPYMPFKSWGPIVQAVSGLTFSSGLPDREPAGWGYSYMDHTGGYMMAIALLAALFHRRRTGEGQWVDMACMEAAASLNGPALLDVTVNNRPLARPGSPNSNRDQYQSMAPHGIYPTVEDDRWVAIACRDDADWAQLGPVLDAPAGDRFADPEMLDKVTAVWTAQHTREEIVAALRSLGVPVAPVLLPHERTDEHAGNTAWGLFPTVTHTKHGSLRVDGLPVHLSRTDWKLEHGGPLLGEDNVRVFHEVLGLPLDEVEQLHAAGVI